MAEQFRGDQVEGNGCEGHTHNRAGAAAGMPVNGARNQFLARPGLAGDQNAGVGRSYLGYARKYRLQYAGRSDNLLEHRCLIDFFAQRDILVLQYLLSLLAIFDINRRSIPTGDASLLISQRLMAQKKPAILPVSSP